MKHNNEHIFSSSGQDMKYKEPLEAVEAQEGKYRGPLQGQRASGGLGRPNMQPKSTVHPLRGHNPGY